MESRGFLGTAGAKFKDWSFHPAFLTEPGWRGKGTGERSGSLNVNASGRFLSQPAVSTLLASVRSPAWPKAPSMRPGRAV